MTPLIKAEFRRLLATRMWPGLLLAAAILGGGLIGAMTLVGPENFDPPMPGLDTEAGIRSVLGILGFTAFVPAAIGTVAVTSEYRHHTVAVTFLFAPRRWQVLAAKLVTYGVAGLAYGIVLAGTAAGALLRRRRRPGRLARPADGHRARAARPHRRRDGGVPAHRRRHGRAHPQPGRGSVRGDRLPVPGRDAAHDDPRRQRSSIRSCPAARPRP